MDKSRKRRRNICVAVEVILILLFLLIVCIIVGLFFTSSNNFLSYFRSNESSSADSGIWNKLRLPTSLQPITYDVNLRADINNFNFSGDVNILFKCVDKTNVILLHCIDLDVDLEGLTLRDARSNKTLRYFKKTPWYHEANQYLVMELSHGLLTGKEYILYAEFSAPLGLEVSGFYRASYDTPDGQTRWLGSTMFALTTGRSVFPCFDEPAFKANFTITIDHAPEFTAISNMALETSESLPDGWMRSKFKESVPMSTYLVAFAVTDFEMKEQMTKNGILVRAWARPDAIDTVDYGLSKAVDILDYLGDYYGTEFPLEKMDLIAVPGFSYKAMENWGMVVFEPSKFLYEDGVSSAMDKQVGCIWNAHELAHQWFGNLVTLKWWEDTWLNEGFASYVEYLGTNHTEPEWNMEDLFLYRDLHPVLVTDSLTTSRPISIPVSTLDEIYAQFDIISYNKGASLLRMLSNFLGESTFRKGLKNYLHEYAYQNADKDDLWEQLNNAAIEDSLGLILPSNVKEIMDTWTLQMGYPVVTVTRTYGRGNGHLHCALEHERFLLNPQSDTTSAFDDLGYSWYIPLTYTTVKSQDFTSPPTEWMSPEMTSTATVQGVGDSDWMLGNVEGRGYYRVNYDAHNWMLLIQQLVDNHEVIKTSSRTTLLNDAFNLARAGLLDYAVPLKTTQYMTSERDYVPWATLQEVTGYIGSMLRRSRAYGDFQKYMLALVTPIYEYIGWEDPGTHLKRQLQSVVITLACSYGHKDCKSQAANQFSEWMQNSETNNIKPDLKLSVYCTAIADGGQDEWMFAFNQYKLTSSDTEKVVLLSAMACTRQTWIIHTYLSYILEPEVIRVNDAEKVITGMSKNDIGAGILWNFFWANWDYFHMTYNEAVFDFVNIVNSLTSGLNTEYELKNFQSLLEANPDQGLVARTFQQAVEATRTNIQWMNTNYDQIADWLDQQSQ